VFAELGKHVITGNIGYLETVTFLGNLGKI
jgi:hypothetical protein